MCDVRREEACSRLLTLILYIEAATPLARLPFCSIIDRSTCGLIVRDQCSASAKQLVAFGKSRNLISRVEMAVMVWHRA